MLELLEFEITGDDREFFYVEEHSTFNVPTGPVWQQGAGVRRPVCCVKDPCLLQLVARIRLAPTEEEPTSSNLDLEARSTVPALTFRGLVEGSPGQESKVVLDLHSGQLENAVKKEVLALDWSFREGSGQPWTQLLTTGGLVIYQTDGPPKISTPYDLALDLACEYVEGKKSLPLAICQGIASDILYNPSLAPQGSVLDLYLDKEGDCNAHAALMEHLCCSIGVSAEKEYLWGGTQQARVHYVYQARNGDVWRPTLQLDAPAREGAEEDPHFQHHVRVDVAGTIYDPAYGIEVPDVDVLETEPNCALQRASSLILKGQDSTWSCPHSAGGTPEAQRRRHGRDALGHGRGGGGTPTRSIAEVDVPTVLARLVPDWQYLRAQPTAEGFAHRFEIDSERRSDVTVGIHADAESALSEWQRQVAGAERPPLEKLELGDTAAIWPPPPPGRRFRGSLAFARWNCFVRVSGQLSRQELERIGAGFAEKLTDPDPGAGVVVGDPSVPVIRTELETSSVVVPAGFDEIEFRISLEHDQEEAPLLFAPDSTIGRVRIEPETTYVFYPTRPGRRECSLVALSRTGAVATTTFWVEVTTDEA